MSNFLGTYDPKQVTLQVGTKKISGFFDGTFITVALDDNEIYKNHVGPYGEVSRTKSNNRLGTVTFTLKQTSPSNAVLDKIKNNPATFPVQVKNNSGGKMIATAAEAWISTDPDNEFSDEESGIEWVVTCAELVKSHLT